MPSRRPRLGAPRFVDVHVSVDQPGQLGRASITMAATVNVLLEITAASEEVAAHAEHDGIPVEPVSRTRSRPRCVCRKSW
ncbi:MAG TPA: hypothetical protein VGO16_09095 [Pseudonocardiaceae bacterium]|nr:hypothetical protein [Pseudonocardiaceae bacterium]